MSKETKVRWSWLKAMYIYTIIVAGGFGLGIIFVPNLIASIFRMPTQDPITMGILGSIYIASAALALLGLRSPLKFVPILLLQLVYKVVWFIGIILPVLIAAKFPAYAISFVIVFATFIIGDLIAIPFSYVFKKQPEL